MASKTPNFGKGVFPYQPVPPGKPPKSKRFGWLALLIAGVIGLGIGGVGSLTSGGDPVAVPAPTVTVTETEAAPVDEPTETATDEPTEEPAGFKPRKKDWEVKVKITDKQCFGSAGCSIEFKIDPSYVGSQSLPDSGVIEVTYEITGDEDPIIGTFTVEGGDASYDKTGSMSTPSSGTKVKARITDVSYDPNG